MPLKTRIFGVFMEKKIKKLTDFAFIPNGIEKYKSDLANMATKEEWGKPVLTENKQWSYPVLWNYLTHTFLKLYNDKKITYTSNNNYCCFNTGLLNTFDNRIYAIFQRNKKDSASPWISRGFCKDSDYYLSSYCDGKYPERADYFSIPSKLLYNPKKEIIVNYEHIIQDNKERFPKGLKNKPEEEIKIYLSGVIERIRKRLICNYKIAVPQYYNGIVQLLIPLYLTEGSDNPDLALAIRENEYNYTASTCLTIGMAYNNARLIVQPQSDWLKPT